MDHLNIGSFSYYSPKDLSIRQIEKIICRIVEYLKSKTLFFTNYKNYDLKNYKLIRIVLFTKLANSFMNDPKLSDYKSL